MLTRNNEADMRAVEVDGSYRCDRMTKVPPGRQMQSLELQQWRIRKNEFRERNSNCNSEKMKRSRKSFCQKPKTAAKDNQCTWSSAYVRRRTQEKRGLQARHKHEPIRKKRVRETVE